MCCASFFALDRSNYIGWGAGINNNGGHFADGSGFYPDVVPIYHSRTAGKVRKKLGQLQLFLAVFSQECMDQLASFGPT
jgi:hypothetical protein